MYDTKGVRKFEKIFVVVIILLNKYVGRIVRDQTLNLEIFKLKPMNII